MRPDAYFEVRFKAPEEGGRLTPVRGEFYACPAIINGEAFDCRLLIKGLTLELGKQYEVPIKFMNWELVKEKLTIGKEISLWEGKDVGVAKVLRCFDA